MREHLLAACLHNPAYDPQAEGSRAGWLMGMLDSTEDPAFYFDAILAELAAYEPDGSGSWDPVQWCDFARHLAQRGFAQARALIYRAHEKAMDSSFSWLGYEEILELDRLEGLAWLVRCVGLGILEGTGCATDRGADTIVAHAKELLGADLVSADLQRRAAEDPAIAAYLAGTEESDREHAEHLGREATSVGSYLLETLAQPPSEFELQHGVSSFRFNWRGVRADEATLEQVFDRLLQEQDRIRLWRHLAVFELRRLPRLHPRLFELAAGPDPDLARAAIDALRHTKEPAVLALGQKLLHRAETMAQLEDAVAALTFQFDSPDVAIVLAKLPGADALDGLDPEDVHRFGAALLKWAEQGADPALAEALIWHYEATSCMECRRRTVEHLLAMDRLPPELAAECLDDECEETRALVRRG